METTGPSTNEMLGFSANARLLIINADDFGMCHSINLATIQSIKKGLAASCTIMVPCPWSRHGINLLTKNLKIPFGIHLTAVGQQHDSSWSSISPPNKVSSILNEYGFFYSQDRINELLRRAHLSELEKEFRAQIEWVLAMNLQPTHLDSHCLLHTRNDMVFDMTFGLAKEYGLALRIGEHKYINKLQQLGFPTDNHSFLDSYRIATRDKTSTYIKLLRELPPGLSEWGIHPGIANADLKAINSEWDVCEADFNFLMSTEARKIVEDEGIIIMSYRRLQELWKERG